MFLRVCRPQMPGKRQTTSRCAPGLAPTFARPRLGCGFVRRAGRGLSGSRTVFSKGRLLYKPNFQKLYWPSAGFFTLGLVTSILPHRSFSGTLMLIRLAGGAWFQTPAPARVRPMGFLQATPSSYEIASIVQPQPWWWTKISALPPYAKICAVAERPGGDARFARAPHTTCLLLMPIYLGERALLRLPSGQLYIVNNQVFASRGTLGLGGASPLSTLAGFWRNHGWCPSVRGTAMNPNDHPHGGRTRAIRYARTPWGRTAKNSRQPRLVPRFKSLAKRKPRAVSNARPYWEATLASPADTAETGDLAP